MTHKKTNPYKGDRFGHLFEKKDECSARDHEEWKSFASAVAVVVMALGLVLFAIFITIFG